jgi:hypothetical protein
MFKTHRCFLEMLLVVLVSKGNHSSTVTNGLLGGVFALQFPFTIDHMHGYRSSR